MKTIISIFALLLLVGLMTQPVFAQNVEDGIVAYWDFNETSGETASDVSGNGHDGTLMGDPKWTNDGYFGGAIEFDQVGDEVNVPYHEDLNQETFTISAWANVEPGSAGHRAVVSSRHKPPTSGYIFYAEPGHTWEFWTGGDGGWVTIQGPAVNLGEWDHIAGTFADSKLMFYVNGELVGEKDSNLNFNLSQEFLIGADTNEHATREYLFKGKVDEVRVYNRVLDENEITAVMKSDSLSVDPSHKIAVTWGKLKEK